MVKLKEASVSELLPFVLCKLLGPNLFEFIQRSPPIRSIPLRDFLDPPRLNSQSEKLDRRLIRRIILKSLDLTIVLPRKIQINRRNHNLMTRPRPFPIPLQSFHKPPTKFININVRITFPCRRSKSRELQVRTFIVCELNAPFLKEEDETGTSFCFDRDFGRRFGFVFVCVGTTETTEETIPPAGLWLGRFGFGSLLFLGLFLRCGFS